VEDFLKSNIFVLRKLVTGGKATTTDADAPEDYGYMNACIL
jgi:hypothetical protein